MTEYTVGIIGTGADRGGTESTGAAMGYRHASAYAELDNCELHTCADISIENARRFADEFGIDETNVYEEYQSMLREESLDIVGITTPIPTHGDIVIDCARSGVQAIHCEKPMSDSWGDCRLMVQECDRNDVQLSFNHQLRFAEPVHRVRSLLDDGAIGNLQRVEMSRSDLFEAGVHQMDLCCHFAGDVPAEWVIGQVDYHELEVRNGVHIEDQTVGTWEYSNGVHGFASTGDGEDAIGCHIRLVGTDGSIELNFWGGDTIRVLRADEGPEVINCENGTPLPDAIDHVVESLDTGTEPLLSGRNALTATELLFGIYESARRRGRVDLPLRIDDNPLQAMIDSGDLDPQ